MGSQEQDSLIAAWQEYLEATKGLEEPRYTDAESWAWARLKQRLEQLAPAA